MKVTIVPGDITKVAVDAIVNAAKPSLLGGGGVDGAIHRAAGPKLLEACRAFPLVPESRVNAATRFITAEPVRCPVGAVRLTPGFDLPARYIIHTVGPRYDATQVEQCEAHLFSTYHSSLRLAEVLGCRTIAFPAISCGVYGYPLAEAATIAVSAARDKEWALDEVRFVLFDDVVLEAFQAAMELIDAV